MNPTAHPFSKEEIMAFVDGQLSEEQSFVVSAHLDSCPDCSLLAADLRRTSQQVSGWRVELLPERISQEVSSAAAREFASRKVRKGRPFSVVGWSIAAMCATLLFLAIATPNLLRPRYAANEAAAVGSLRSLNTAATGYSITYGHFPRSLKNFGPPSSGVATEDAAALIDSILAGGTKSGYIFSYRSFPFVAGNAMGGYSITATPLQPGTTGYRQFFTDQTGVIFSDGHPLDGSTPSAASERASSKVESGHDSVQSVSGPMIARVAVLKLVVEKLDSAREGMDRILMQHKGYVAQLSFSAENDSAHSVVASLRVPADQLDDCIAQLKQLGHVTQESQSGEEVTQQHIDLSARLKNSRNTEGRLNEVLQHRSGVTKDVLEVEKESARVRGEIEQMEAERQNLEHRVEFATINLNLSEEFKAQLSSPAASPITLLRNAAVSGFRNAFESLLGMLLFLTESAPTMILWLAILFLPSRFFWRRYLRAYAASV
jgi:uncharacterized protein DUF4349/putative zinc finger protein